MPRQKLTEEEKQTRVKEKRERGRNRYQRLKENSEALAQRRERDKELQKIYRRKANVSSEQGLHVASRASENENQRLDGFQKSNVVDSDSTNEGNFTLDGVDDEDHYPLNKAPDFEEEDIFEYNRPLDCCKAYFCSGPLISIGLWKENKETKERDEDDEDDNEDSDWLDIVVEENALNSKQESKGDINQVDDDQSDEEKINHQVEF